MNVGGGDISQAFTTDIELNATALLEPLSQLLLLSVMRPVSRVTSLSRLLVLSLGLSIE